MLSHMQSHGLDPDLILAKVSEAEDRKARALAEYQAAVAELEWWKQGQRLFGVHTEDEGLDPSITELFPPADAFSGGMQPTLRQAIVAVMRGQPGTHWRVSDLAGALMRAGWLPEREDAAKRVSDMAGIMAGDGQLYRVARGVYALAPELAAAFEASHGNINRHVFFGGQPSDKE
jgi:hypothetical protein